MQNLVEHTTSATLVEHTSRGSRGLLVEAGEDTSSAALIPPLRCVLISDAQILVEALYVILVQLILSTLALLPGAGRGG